MPDSRPGDSEKTQRLNAAIGEYLSTVRSKKKIDPNALLAKYPDVADKLRAFLKLDSDGSAPPPATLPPQNVLRSPPPQQGPPKASQNAQALTPKLPPTPPPPRVATPANKANFQVGVQTLPPSAPLDGRLPAAPFPPSRPSAVLPHSGRLGEFELLEEIGRGGMGIVYKARQTSLKGRLVAVKMLLHGNFASKDEIQRFLGDAEKAGQLQHPNIVRVHGRSQEGQTYYFAMDYVQGQSLEQVARRGPMNVERAARYVEIVARAVHFAHTRGILHRDLKPSNILVNGDDQPIVTDFGLAKCIGERTAYTRTGDILGTPGYMSPEQAAGQHRELTSASDVYSLGAVLYDLLTGAPPFHGKTPWDTLREVQNSDPVPIRRLNGSIPRDIETICMKCLEKDASKRYASALVLADDLRHFQAGEPIEARSVSFAERVWKRCRRSPVAAGLVTLAAVALVAFSLLLLQMRLAHRQTDAERKNRIREQANALLIADADRVLDLLKKLNPTDPDVVACLKEMARQDSLTVKERIRVALGLLPTDAEQRAHLRDLLLEADRKDVKLVRTALAPHGSELAAGLWSVVNNKTELSPRRFRAACGLAEFDGSNANWRSALGGEAVSELLSQDPREALDWVELLLPVRQTLITPLQTAFRNQKSPNLKNAAMRLLVECAADDPAVLVELIADADASQFGLVLPKLKRHPAAAQPMLLARLQASADAKSDHLSQSTTYSTSGASLNEESRARFAVALMHLGEDTAVWPLLQDSPQPQLRTCLIHDFSHFDVDPMRLIQRLGVETNNSVRQALILGLGQYAADRVPSAEKQGLLARLLSDYEEDPDPGIHAAIDWLVRQWGIADRLREINSRLIARKEMGPRHWYTNSLGGAMTIVPGPIEYSAGMKSLEENLVGTGLQMPNPGRHMRRIPRTFAISSNEISQEQFNEFRTISLERDARDGSSVLGQNPILGVNWHQAARFCIWLSHQEGIPEDQICYRVSSVDRSSCEPYPDFLLRTGYRLPTNAEWEYACRAGTDTARFFGSGLQSMPDYAWTAEMANNRASPVGLRKPNGLGLFDVYGNAGELCSDCPTSLRRQFLEGFLIDAAMTIEDVGGGEGGPLCAVRGGAFTQPSLEQGSVALRLVPSAVPDASVGFRIARTLQTHRTVAARADSAGSEAVDRSRLKTVAVASMASLADLSDRIGYLTDLVRRADIRSYMDQNFAMNVSDARKFSKNRLGAVIQMSGGDNFVPIFFTAFDDEMQALALCRSLFPLQQPLGDGIFRFHGAPPMYFRFSDGRGFLTTTQEQIESRLLLPARVELSSLETYDFALTLAIEQIANQSLTQRAANDETDFGRAIEREIRDITYGFRISKETRNAFLDVVLRCKPDSALSKTIANWGSISSRFARLRASDATVKCALTIRLDDWMQRELLSLLKQQRVSTPVDDSIMEPAERLIRGGMVDVALNVDTRPGLKPRVIAAAHLPRADLVDGILRRIGPINTRIDFDIANYRGWKIHETRIDVDDSMREIFPGERVALYFAFSRDAVAILMGGDGIDGLKQVLDGVATAGAPGPPVERFVFDMAEGKLLGLLLDAVQDPNFARFLKHVSRESFDHDNRLRLIANPHENGLRLRLEIQEGYLRLLGETLAYFFDIGIGSAIPGARDRLERAN